MSTEEHPAKAEMEEFTKAVAGARSAEQIQRLATALQEKGGNHVYLDTVGVASAFAVMTRVVDGTGHAASYLGAAKHMTNSVVQAKRALRKPWVLLLLIVALMGMAVKRLL
mmetsp:Transcript_62722/g.117320  ORF Transcript_62722/g.117320 Transcript_62722/m.117320 type:complete len:111 (-) Transcript_62722:100-432(-)